MFNNRSIYFKLLTLLFIGLFLNGVFFLVGFIYSAGKMTETSKNVASDKVLIEVENSMQFAVQATISAMQNLYQENSNPKSVLEVRALIKREFDSVRYGEAGYFFVYQYDGVRLVAPENKEFIMAGATAVAVGTGNFKDPTTVSRIIEGIEEFLGEEKIFDITQLRGIAQQGF